MSQVASQAAPRPWPSRMDRRTASEYLRETHGIRLSPGTLAKKAVRGDGPAYFKDGPRVVYDQRHLDVYAVERLGEARRSTSDESA